jgi:hypothetical protein
MSKNINELSDKTKANYLIKRMAQYKDGKFKGDKQERVKGRIKKTFKQVHGNPKPDQRGRVRNMGESINYRIARIIVEAYLEERGYAGKVKGFEGVYRRTKSGEGSSGVVRKSAPSEDNNLTKSTHSSITKNAMKMAVKYQNATGKGNKAKRRMKFMKEARGYAGRVDKKGGIARRFKSGERNRGTEGINQWQNASHTLPGSRGTSKTRGLGLIDRETRRARTRNDMKDNINMDNADTGVGRVKISSKNRKKLLGDKGK